MLLTFDQANSILVDYSVFNGTAFTLPNNETWHPIIVRGPYEPDLFAEFAEQIIQLLPDVNAAFNYFYESPTGNYDIFVFFPDFANHPVQFHTTWENWVNMANVDFDINNYVIPE